MNGEYNMTDLIASKDSTVPPGAESCLLRNASCPRCVSSRGFTILELVVVIAALALLVLTLAPALARTGQNGDAYQCLNNQRQLATAWRQWSADNNDYLLTCQGTKASPRVGPNWDTRPNWMVGGLNWGSDNFSNYDPGQNILPSPIWPYTGSATLFKCPADRSTIMLSSPWNGNPVGTRVPRVRSYSMSQVFGLGEWLDGDLHASSFYWRTYGKGSEIVIPAKTFLFMDEHPGSINDGAFACCCTTNQPTDPPSAAKLIDMPGNLHNGGCSLSFADNHVELHKWRSPYLKNLPNNDGSYPPLNITIGSLDPLGYLDARWLAERTTVAK